MTAPTYADYLSAGFTPLFCKGWHPKYNSTKNYRTAKEPAISGWNRPDYSPPSIQKITVWTKAAGWTGWVIPKGMIVLDVEDADDIARVREICRERAIEPGIHLTNNGVHFFFHTDQGLSASSKVYTQCGIGVTYRLGAKNYLILAPINERKWELWKRPENFPSLPEEFLPYDRKSLQEVLNCLSRQVAKAYREGHFSGYDDIDAAFMALLIECGLPCERIHEVFKIIFGADYDERQTEGMHERTREKIKAGNPVVGAGTFMQRVKGRGLTEIERFVRELQAFTGSGRITVGTEVTVGSKDDLALIEKASFPFEIFPSSFLDLIQRYSAGLQVEPELIALLTMGVLSGAIGNTVRVSVKEGWDTPLFLWITIIKESGYGQSPAQNAILLPVKLLQAKDTDRYNADLEAYDEAVRKAKKDDSVQIPEKPKAIQKLLSSTTIEALADAFEHDGRGSILDKDELSGFVHSFDQYKAHGGDDRQSWLSMFNCAPLKIDRKGVTRFIRNTGIAIMGGIQPKILPDVFSDKAFDDGLLPRFLLYHAENSFMPFNRKGISEEARKAWQALVTDCYHIPCEHDEYGFIKPKILILEDQALDLWEVFYNECAQKAPFLSEKARVFIPKLSSYYSLKFAGILHVLYSVAHQKEMSLLIHKDIVESALALTRFFMWQVVRALRLYHKEGESLDEYQKRLIQTLYALKDAVKHGKLALSRITHVFNGKLPERTQFAPEKLVRSLNQLGLRTEKSTGNLSYLIWEEARLEKFFSQITVPTVPTVTIGRDKETHAVTEGTVDSIRLGSHEEVEDQAAKVFDLTGANLEVIA